MKNTARDSNLCFLANDIIWYRGEYATSVESINRKSDSTIVSDTTIETEAHSTKNTGLQTLT